MHFQRRYTHDVLSVQPELLDSRARVAFCRPAIPFAVVSQSGTVQNRASKTLCRLPQECAEQSPSYESPEDWLGGVLGPVIALLRAATAAKLGTQVFIMPTQVGGPQPESARQGRELQRYGVNGERLVAGCIPVRVLKPGTSEQQVEILLISSRGGDGLVIPKGGWETDETVEDAAKRETVEEAGVRGRLEVPMVGCFPFSSTKAARLRDAPRGCIAHVFAMHVAEELSAWPESDQRSRTWTPLLSYHIHKGGMNPSPIVSKVPAEEACARCRHEWMRQAVASWLKRFSHNSMPAANGGPPFNGPGFS